MISHNPLIDGITRIQDRVLAYANDARDFYFQLVLTVYLCPSCGGQMRIVAPGHWMCECRTTLDPTIAFQRCTCCNAQLAFRRTHYACTHCGQIVRSMFLFDERIIDAEYFREKMSEWRENKRRQREERRLFLAASRSNPLLLAENPDSNALRGLFETLDEFLGEAQMSDEHAFHDGPEYRLNDYRQMILSRLAGTVFHFEAFPALIEDRRLDRVRRFLTLLFMEQAGEVLLEQRGGTILVIPHETYHKRS